MSKRALLARTLEQTGSGSLLSKTVARWSGLLVFNYHRIGDPQGALTDQANFSATAECFAEQVRFVKKHFDLIGAGDLETACRGEAGRAVLLTFDDGYRDNYELAFPVLKQEGGTALFFLTSGFLDDRTLAWWDEIAWMVRSASANKLHMPGVAPEPLPLNTTDEQARTIEQLLRAYKQLPSARTSSFLNELAHATEAGRAPTSVADPLWMTWDMVREMEQAGMEFGGHTVTHPVLANCSLEQQQLEIDQSKHRIEAELGRPVTTFSYPVGQPDSFSEVTKAVLQQAGYRWAFSFYGGYLPAQPGVPSPLDSFDLPRMPVSHNLPPDLFRSIARLPQLFARK